MLLLNIETVVILLSGIIVFLSITILLVALLLFARKKLTPQGKVKLLINGEKELDVDPGSSLLTTLANEKIFLPSACGGGGTCAMCKCQITSGAGSILPTETIHFTKKEQLNNWRLSCQVKVRSNLEMLIPKEIFGIKKWECEVLSNRNVATFIKELVIKLPENTYLDFQPGGYVQIDVPPCEISFKDFEIDELFHKDWENLGMWNLKMKSNESIFRAYSMANHPSEGNIIILNVRIATPPWDHSKNRFKKVNPGICSSYIFSLKPGDKIMVSGPYGEFHIKPTQKEMVYIGGGAGMAPLRSQILHLFKTEKTSRKVSFWYGARSLREIFYLDEFREIEKNNSNFSFNIALSEPLPEDRWTGYAGFIHQVVYDQYLSKLSEPEEVEYYLCGPPVMNEAVLKMLDELGVQKENIAFDDFGI